MEQRIKSSSQHNLFSESLIKLSRWYFSHSRELPWRDTPTPYYVWVSEIMLQQTQVATVIPYFNRFISEFPTLESLANANESQVLALWSGLGYYSRARNLHKTAKFILERGDFPSTREALEALPGIGPYTAGAILSIAFNQYEAILDGNLDRVFSRLLELPKNLMWKKRLWKISRLFILRTKQLSLSASDVNQALMELGALVCRPSSPDCALCPLQLKCRAYKHKSVSRYPEKGKKRQTVEIAERAYALIDGKGRLLLLLDKNARWRKGSWDFPTALPEAYAMKNFTVHLEREPININLTVTHHKITRELNIYHLKEENISNMQIDDKEFKWYNLDEIEDLPKGSPLIKSLGTIC